ncbi:hypothetical protein QJS66_22650 [Kocuria rhizophila]|nr:hypothetical protein QJS66_22650 [Kocuria rhizophila]
MEAGRPGADPLGPAHHAPRLNQGEFRTTIEVGAVLDSEGAHGAAPGEHARAGLRADLGGR